MILCVSASPALDLTYRVERLTAGATNRVLSVVERAGGKAVNVARVLHTLGEDVMLLATAGGQTGRELADRLQAVGLPHRLVATAQATRRTVAIVDDATGDVTMLNEPAALDDWQAFLDGAAALIPTAEVVVISGRLPAGAPPDGFARITTMARVAGRRVVLDTSGPALPEALAARPTIVKPNAEELRECVGDDDPVLAAHSLARQWQVGVVASLGAGGLIAVEGSSSWQARPRRRLAGNPTGAGDAVVAGIARGLHAGSDLSAILPDCVALGAAAVLAPSAGELDIAQYREQAADVVVERVDGLSP
jgi:tagatose 6-phosphate kinase